MKNRVLKKLLATVALLLCSMVAMAQTTATVDGITYEFITKGKFATVVASASGSYTGNIVIPETVEYDGVVCSVTAIGQGAFRSCDITSVTIPNSVTTIGNNAFTMCDITSVTIPNSVTTIGSSAFNYCNGLTSVTIPNSVTTIGGGAFSWCESLTSVTIGDGVTTIEEYAFSACHALTSVIIGNGVTTIGHHAFNGCGSLTNVTIGNSVTTIGGNAFYTCYGLTSVTIPNSVTTIGSGAFACTGLTSVTIPNSVTTIEDFAFSDCTGLTSVTIPNSVTTIGGGAFSDCTGLTSITIPNSVTTIGSSAFLGCTGLTSVIIGNSVTTIEGYAFYGCTGITSITIPNSVTKIKRDVFENCTALETVVIGESVKTIGSSTFANCGNLANVYCLATNAPTVETEVIGEPDFFQNSYIEYATLHVPEESIDSYKSTAPWSGFGTIKAIDGDIPGTQTPVTPKCATPVITYSAGKLSITCDTEDAQFVTTIADSDIRTHYGSEIALTVTYNITTYATLAGYENSDTIQATLCWIDSTPTMEQTGTDVTEIASTPVLVRSSDGNIFVSGASEGTAIRVYSIDGMSVGSAVSNAGETTVPTTLQKGKTAIVAIGDSRIKMVMR